MSYDQMGGPPQRPRSTPIPDPDDAGSVLPPPTPAQFLGEQSVPWTPQPGPSVNASFGATPGMSFSQPAVASKTLIISILLFTVLLGGVITFIAVHTANDALDKIPKFPSSQNLPVSPTAATSPDTFEVLPNPTAATSLEPTPPTATPPLGTAAVPTTVPSIPFVLQGTLPAAPGTDPGSAGAVPSGSGSLFDPGAARPVADQLELALAGDPSQLTQVVFTSGYALATAEDPANPGKLIGAYWTGGSISDATITSTGGSGDLSFERFTEGEVNWESLATLVPQAPGLLNIPDGQVTNVVVQRVGTGNPPPIVIDVYVDGPSGSGYVEASAAGDVTSVHHG
ncbi:MAG: hypothetical protein JWM34_226 [Ilumatobacteraceae bacterium]|nr:hypothetical protein [Ilumatobacteraceae bacterium]